MTACSCAKGCQCPPWKGCENPPQGSPYVHSSPGAGRRGAAGGVPSAKQGMPCTSAPVFCASSCGATHQPLQLRLVRTVRTLQRGRLPLTLTRRGRNYIMFGHQYWCPNITNLITNQPPCCPRNAHGTQLLVHMGYWAPDLCTKCLEIPSSTSVRSRLVA
jgi:hypothetical protein